MAKMMKGKMPMKKKAMPMMDELAGMSTGMGGAGGMGGMMGMGGGMAGGPSYQPDLAPSGDMMSGPPLDFAEDKEPPKRKKPKKEKQGKGKGKKAKKRLTRSEKVVAGL